MSVDGLLEEELLDKDKRVSERASMQILEKSTYRKDCTCKEVLLCEEAIV